MSWLNPLFLINLSPTMEISEPPVVQLSFQKEMRLPSPIRHEVKGSMRCHNERKFLRTHEHFAWGLECQRSWPPSKCLHAQFAHMLPEPSVRRCHKCFRAVALLQSESFLMPSLPSFLGFVTYDHATRALLLSMVGPYQKNLANSCSILLYTFGGSIKRKDH